MCSAFSDVELEWPCLAQQGRSSGCTRLYCRFSWASPRSDEAGGGRYDAYVRAIDNLWYECDDNDDARLVSTQMEFQEAYMMVCGRREAVGHTLTDQMNLWKFEHEA